MDQEEDEEERDYDICTSDALCHRRKEIHVHIGLVDEKDIDVYNNQYTSIF